MLLRKFLTATRLAQTEPERKGNGIMARIGLTLIDILTIIVIVVIVLLVATQLLKFPHYHSKGLRGRLECGNHLKGLGTAMNIYAFDYNDTYPVIGGENAPWTKRLGWEYDATDIDYSEGGKQKDAGRTITASWYLLVREADVDPKSLVCKDSKQRAYEPAKDQDLVDLWDFGDEPYKHVSYSTQMPFGNYPATGSSAGDNAIAGDLSPWFKDGDMVLPGTTDGVPQLITAEDITTHKVGNSLNHDGGQNVLFGDGHVEFTIRSNVGQEHDNIYTYWSATENPTEQDKQGGSYPIDRSKETDSKAAADSFLAI